MTARRRHALATGPTKKKVRYHLKNWKGYNRALVARGSLTVWLEPRVLKHWRASRASGKPGHPFFYSAWAMQMLLVLQTVYRLPLRQTQGLALSLLKLLRVRQAVPHYSTLCRRRKHPQGGPLGLRVALPRQPRLEGLHLVVDSTGLKIYGEGEWRVRQQGVSYHRTWRRLHIGLDEATGLLTAVVLTDNLTSDHEVFPALVEQTRLSGRLRQVSGDGGYDQSCVHRYLQDTVPAARNTIVPRRNARLRPSDDSLSARHANIARIQAIGRAAWKRESGYHRRSLVETTMFRLKQLFGPSLSARRLASQTTQVHLRAWVLNQMTRLGMPDAYPVT